MTDLTRLSATEMAKAIRDGRTTSEAVVAAALERIAARESEVGAWAHLDPEYALRQARACDAARRMVSDLPPLFGVPAGVKDIIDTGELPTENGTSIFAGRRPERDAFAVLQLKRAGAVILGKTVTTELAFFGPGKTRNPHNLAHTPGGSSSGSAAAVADFHVPLALGSQTAGSIIRPASYCGVIGFKPTFGMISRTGVLAQSPPLDTLGGYARSIDDIALLAEAMAGYDARDADMAEGDALKLAVELRKAETGALKLAFVRSPAWPMGEPAMHAAFDDLIARLGTSVEEIELPDVFAETGGSQRAVQFRDIAKNYGPLRDVHPDIISAKLAEVIETGRSVTDAEYEAALAQREKLYGALLPILARFDAILTPAATGPAPEGLASTGSPAFNFLWTYLRTPAISLPLLEANGLPLGVQLVGARGADAKLLLTAKRLAEAAGRWA